MYRKSLMAASLALLLAGPATADDDKQRGTYAPERRGWDDNRHGDHDRDRGRGHDRHANDRDGWRRHDGGWRNDGWRHHRWHDNRHWRHFPPSHYQLDFGYRSGYELAWRDWLNRGRYNRYWRRNSFYGYGVGHTYRTGYEAGWRDAALYYGRGYRPDYWAYDPRDGWFFGFHVQG
jgi:hypothetical protein